MRQQSRAPRAKISLLVAVSIVTAFGNLAGVTPAGAAAGRSLRVANASITEGNRLKTMTFKVSLSSPSSRDVTVSYSTIAGTAAVPADFRARSGRLTIRAGQTSKTIGVPIVGDASDEPLETFTVKLSKPSGASIADATGVGTIKDDDGSPQVEIYGFEERWGFFRVDESESNVTIPIKLSAPSGFTVSVDYATSNINATAGEDYTQTSDTLTFQPGETEKSIQVPILQDATEEEAEYFEVTLSNPVKAELPPFGSGAGIVDDDCIDGSDEPNDDVGSAILLSESSPYPGVSCPLEDDYFKIGLQRGQILTLSLTYDDVNEGPLLMAINDQANFGSWPPLATTESTFLEFAAPKSASYYVWVAGGARRTSYEILANVSTPPACTEDAQEPNDVRSAAKALAPGTDVPGTICSGDVDFFKFTTKKYDTVRLRMESVSVTGNLDFEVLDAQGNMYANTFGENDVELAEFVAPTASTWYVRVYSALVGVQNPYEISLRRTPIGSCTNDAFEPNNRAGSATPLPTGVRRNAKICPDDTDFWKFSATKGKLVKPSIITGTDAGLVYGGIYGPGGTPVTGLDPMSDSNFIAPKTGTYVVELIGSPPWGKLPYSIKVAVTPIPACTNDGNEPNDEYSLATSIALNAPQSGQICLDDSDWWSFTVGDQTAHVELSSVASNGDLDLLIYGPDGVTQIDGQGGPQDLHVIEFSQGPGTYYAVVIPASSTVQNSYQLTITEVPTAP